MANAVSQIPGAEAQMDWAGTLMWAAGEATMEAVVNELRVSPDLAYELDAMPAFAPMLTFDYNETNATGSSAGFRHSLAFLLASGKTRSSFLLFLVQY